MHARLVSYLQDNREQIIENWLAETEVPAPRGSPTEDAEGVVPCAFFAGAFDRVLQRLAHGSEVQEDRGQIHLNALLGLTCDCKQRAFGGRVCMELHDSGLAAFMSVFAEDWDTEHEFNELDRECSKDLINHALSGFFGREIELCLHRTFRVDCPFAACN